ncbi:2S seed storage protein 1 [Sesamum indicum]|uniref:2S seed storage protein 1 n=1 Tax=Sesamum indicum TaxID=4182 RepID=2SS1_SESIN|nr:2S seed storage protein 1 precursor [Sesamum indicum]Q9XHP1.1 RecName: Full=2S seed storage protein 1; AltName: Full=2S albumin; AltName: Full=2S albumin storage protein; AltName: Full=Allergen Ses i 2; AltName: Full=Beta-globulin; AltName: Allergen=Ses i 2.0101; Contains: RecName: Full=2S seed storage protein 1 small subunit; Contains: RecName: Full=2S seed storage protein 1 large subunit; Flags: Precursor [Sesamum indicum]AAD42943.1 2S albumin precursor [Sesamum indicum]
MARFTIVLAVLFAAALVSASAHKTVVTTSVAEEGEEENQRGCEWESRQCQMRHCMQWMRSMRGQYEESFLRSAEANQGQFEHFRECCNELRDVKSHCRCEALRCMMRQMQQEYGMEQEMQQMQQMMQYLPRMCGMSYPTECRMRPIFA